jgi:hypothetical protein
LYVGGKTQRTSTLQNATTFDLTRDFPCGSIVTVGEQSSE